MDRKLLLRIASGDMASMKLLYERHSDGVQRFALSRLREPFEVSDIVHNTLLDVWRNAGSFQGRSTVRTWMLSIARNKIVDHIRKQSRVDVVAPDENEADDAPDAETILTAVQTAKRVRACVDELPEKQRMSIHFAFYEDLSYSEIARVEGKAEGTIKTRIFHAKKLLLRCLSR